MDTDDWPSIIRQHGPLVWKTAYRLVRNTEDANDCYQETFIDAVRESNRKDVANWPGLLVHIATRRAIDLLRQRDSQRRRLDAFAEEPPANRQPEDPSQRASEHELIQRLRNELAEMPEQHALVFSLRHFHDWSDNEIAAQLGLKPGHVRVVLHRVRGQLRERLNQATGPESPRIHP